MDRRRCSTCGREGHDKRSCGRLVRTGKPFDPWSDLEWEEHFEAQCIVRDNPDGMTLEQVGEVLGVTRERVRQIEAQALEKLKLGRDLSDTVTVDGVTVAISICDRCDNWYPRKGRTKNCPSCEAPAPEVENPAESAEGGRRYRPRNGIRTVPLASLESSTRVDKVTIPVVTGGLDDVLAMMFD